MYDRGLTGAMGMSARSIPGKRLPVTSNSWTRSPQAGHPDAG